MMNSKVGTSKIYHPNTMLRYRLQNQGGLAGFKDTYAE